MKRCCLFLVAALAGCSPTEPSPMDVEVAVERYFLQHSIRAQDNYSVIISCAPISEMAVGGRDQKSVHVRFRFQAPAQRRAGGSPIYAVRMMQGGQGWYIPREAKLESLPCEVTNVRDIPRSS
jgi:hypothetical protein